MKGQDEASSIDGFSSDEENDTPLIKSKKMMQRDYFEDNESDDESDHEDDEKMLEQKEAQEQPWPNAEEHQIATEGLETKVIGKDHNEDLKLQKLKNLKKLRAETRNKHKTGVVYLSKIPPYMKPAKMRQVLSRFGVLDRLFLKKEDDQKYKNRVKGGGNKKTMFEEGWAEFLRKKDAKLCASTLNGNIIGGRKGNFYHDDIMNVKYLSGFKWADLTEQIAKENDIKQAKLQLEISQANKLNAEFIRNVEKSKMINKVKAKRKLEETTNEEEDLQRTFKQRNVTTNRASGQKELKQQVSKDLDTVIHNLF
ncbi:LAFE_0C00342g1_1 [Lachancea fermentati]|uniref:Pre-rRNA-processing protein ESF2 n=1 Tax=Lachancea fermentati TaxID=4955 RepID=A0A1G4M975_LACFM|nr:LAFE_0C00342g1_1 [Lachancea fermentati]